MENPLVNSVKSIVNSGETLVNSCKNPEIEIKKVVIPLSNRWKSSRNIVTGRPIVDFVLCLASGVGCFVSLVSTYYGFDIQVQVICYTLTISALLLSDPLQLFCRILSRTSRCIMSLLNVLFIFCIIYKQDNLWLVWLISLLVSIILIFSLNDFWIKQENWKMSAEVEHALHFDPDNRSGQSWQANGRTNTRTVLYSLGVSVNDTDLDTIMKSVYFLGFLNCYKFQQDQTKRIEELEIKTSLMNHYEQQYENTINEYNELVDRYERLMKGYRKLVDETKNKEIEVPEHKEPIGSISITLPKGVTEEQYQKVCELLDKGESFNYIEKITKVSRYKVKQCQTEYIKQKMRIN